MRNQWKSADELQEIQKDRLKKLIYHAYENVPYYRRLFDSIKLKPSDIKDTSDLWKIPITSKKDLISQPLADITAKNINLAKCRVMTTSGTSGVPIKVYYRRRDCTLMNLAWARAYLVHGLKPWHKIGVFTGWHSIKIKKSWYEYLGLFRRKIFYSTDSPYDWIVGLRKWRPQALTGYVMTLKLLALAMQEKKVDDIRPKVIFHTSAILDEYNRRFISDVLKTKIVDIYGSDEGGCIAWECPKCHGYHVNIDFVVLELVKNGEPVSVGEEGEVIITNLFSFAMPLIRYQQADIAAYSTEKIICGRGLPLLKNIVGRIDDFIVLPSGRMISPHPFYWAVFTVPGVSEWRIIQEEKDVLKVDLVVNPSFNNDCFSMIENNLRKLVGYEMKIEIFILDTIQRNPDQKFRSVISKVKKPS